MYRKKSKFRTDEKGREFYGNTLLIRELKEVLRNEQYIYVLECDSPLFYIYIWRNSGIVKKTFTLVYLKDLLELLGGNIFVQANKSGAFNTSYFQDHWCNDKEGYTVLLDQGLTVDVAKDFKKNFRKHIKARPCKNNFFI
jgi:hypothetical protein